MVWAKVVKITSINSGKLKCFTPQFCINGTLPVLSTSYAAAAGTAMRISSLVAFGAPASRTKAQTPILACV